MRPMLQALNRQSFKHSPLFQLFAVITGIALVKALFMVVHEGLKQGNRDLPCEEVLGVWTLARNCRQLSGDA